MITVMYYVSRIELGKALAGRLMELRGQEAVVIALKESALTACIGLASEINAWVYPLLTQRIYVPGDPRIMGLIDETGMFTWNPSLEKMQRDEIEMESHGVLEDAKRGAFTELNRTLGQYGAFNRDALNGRVLLLTGDVIEDRIEIATALQYLKSIRYATLYGLGGNVDAEAADYFHIETDKDVLLDVMTHMFPVEHYFDRQDSYSPEESRQLAVNISQYWT